MSNLIQIDVVDKQVPIKQVGLVESTFEDQVTSKSYPAIYVDLSTSDIRRLSINSGVLSITDVNGVVVFYNVFYKTLLDVCKIINDNTNGGTAVLVSENVGLVSSLQIPHFSSVHIISVDLDKSPYMLTDLHPDTLENLLSFEPTNPSYSVIDVIDENGDSIPYTLSTTRNLYVDRLGKALVEYKINKFVLNIREDNLISTKYLLNLALDNPDLINQPEKDILLSQFLNSVNMFYYG